MKWSVINVYWMVFALLFIPLALPVIAQTTYSAAERSKITSQFQRINSEQKRAHEGEWKRVRRESQKTISKESTDWRQSERSKRRLYFESHMSGKERREYVQDYLARKLNFEHQQERALQILKSDLKSRETDLKVRVRAREKKFKEALSAGDQLQVQAILDSNLDQAELNVKENQ